jgi:hypothetical protein
MDPQKKRAIWENVFATIALLLPIVLATLMNTWVMFFPHSITNMQGRWALSVSFILSVILSIYSCVKIIKKNWIKYIILLLVFFIYLPLSFLVLCRSTCESNYWGEPEEDSSISDPAHQKADNAGACK